MTQPTTTSELILPEHANHYGTLFGGTALGLLAKAAFAAAFRQVGGAVVMAAARQVDFTAPVAVGSLLDLTAQMTGIGQTSLTVEVRGEVAGAKVLMGRFVMVAVDDVGRPRAILETQRKSHEDA
ncbi:MAG: acyl-CoA thioesterase [Methylocystaceae bacterium]|nr:acyl-CoA thioesterase [Methylocystaceae bacterium]